MAKITLTDDRAADLVKQVEQNANYRNIAQISPIYLSEVVKGEYVVFLDLRKEATFYDRVVILAHLWGRGRCMTIMIMLFARWDLLFFRRLEVVFQDNTQPELACVRGVTARLSEMAHVTGDTPFWDVCAAAGLSIEKAKRIFSVPKADAIWKDVCSEEMAGGLNMAIKVCQDDVVPLMLMAMCMKEVFLFIELPMFQFPDSPITPGVVRLIDMRELRIRLIPVRAKSSNVIICTCFASAEEARATCYPETNPGDMRPLGNNFWEVMVGSQKKRRTILFHRDFTKTAPIP